MRTAILFITFISGLILIIMGATGTQTTVIAQGPTTPTPGIGPVLLAGLEQTERRIDNIRGITEPERIQRRLLDAETMRNQTALDFEQNYSPEAATQDAIFYTAFGFLNPGFDLYDTSRAIVASPRSYYDEHAQLINVLSNNDMPLTATQSLSYAYSYILATQDMRYGIYSERDTAIASNNPDRALALNALITGDARLALQQYISELVQTGQITIEDVITASVEGAGALPSGVPNILLAENEFASEVGFRFVRRLYQETESWRLVDLIYERPPLTTEQILHPTLYLINEQPHEVELIPLDDFWASADTNPAVWQLRFDQSLGEFYLREHLALFPPPTTDNPNAAQEYVDLLATGWGGDRFMIYTDTLDNIMMVWRLSWDSQPDFVEFDLRYGSLISRWLNVAGQQFEDGSQCWEGATRSICKIALDEDVLITQAPTLDLALNALLYQRNRLIANPIFG